MFLLMYRLFRERENLADYLTILWTFLIDEKQASVVLPMITSSNAWNNMERNDDEIMHEFNRINPFNPLVFMSAIKFVRCVESWPDCYPGEHITFMRALSGFSDRCSCDFCSIVNGTVYTALHAPLVPQKTPKDIAQFYYGILDAGRYRVPFEFISADTRNALAQIEKVLETIELRWCPFKAMVEYYRNIDPRYIDPEKTKVCQIGALLFKEQDIKCMNCARIANTTTTIITTENSKRNLGIPDKLLDKSSSKKKLNKTFYTNSDETLAAGFTPGNSCFRFIKFKHR